MTDLFRVLHVDDDEATLRQVREGLASTTIGEPPTEVAVTSESEFGSALTLVEGTRIDLVILDVRLDSDPGTTPDEEAGVVVLEELRKRRFIPVIFYTNLNHLVIDLASPFVEVVEKAAGYSGLEEAISRISGRGVFNLNRGLVRHLDDVLRRYMWDFVEGQWDLLQDSPDKTSLAILLARRLAMSLDSSRVEEFAAQLGEASLGSPTSGRIQPIRFYILPPVGEERLAGDLLKGAVSEEEGYWMLLTPSCDLAQNKAAHVLLAACEPLEERPEFIAWSHEFSNSKMGPLKQLLRNAGSDRYAFLPGVLEVPNLVADLQRLRMIPCESLGDLTPIASLDSPFAEALVGRFARFWGRIGTPDLDVDALLARWKSERQKEA